MTRPSRVDAAARIEILRADITTLDVDAIVNAANERLAGGGGVDGAIHRAAGTAELQAACRAIGGCPTGEARITPGFRLPARHIIHTVGPVYRDGHSGEPALLASAYRSSLTLAREHEIATIAFPAISTGAYGYPFDAATRIAFDTTIAFMRERGMFERVTFVFFGEADENAAREIWAAV
ncbi:MAG: O-acetyl-ADP-ribose deacetylase [Phycisphaerales bacterium]|nr:O-acetyl-ADP-ribose deacetylase [Phycisphaerales bacterium]